MRQGLVNAVRDYTETVGKGCTPPSAINWKDPDNNVNFHNKTIMMTHNATISIAAKWLDDMNNDKLKPEERAQAKKNYEELIATAGFPNKPDGKPMQYRAAVKVGVVFENAKNKKRAKEFVAFLMQDENLTPYVEGALGRWYPVTKSGAARKFWTEDPHRKVGARPVLGRHGDLRVHQELEIHHPQQRERLGQGHEPRGHRQVAGGQGGRRDDQAHQGSRRLTVRPGQSGGRTRPGPDPFMSSIAIPHAPPAPPGAAHDAPGRRGALILIAPYVLVFLAFVLYPVTYGLWLARHPASYVQLFADPIFFRTVVNTIVFLVDRGQSEVRCWRCGCRASSCTSAPGSAGCR